MLKIVTSFNSVEADADPQLKEELSTEIGQGQVGMKKKTFRRWRVKF